MKNLTLLLALFLLFSCNNDDDTITPPEREPEPIIANAKVIRNGDCGPDDYLIEFFNVPVDSIPNNVPTNLFSFYFWPDDYRVENLEVFVDFRNPTPQEFRVCNNVGPFYHVFIPREVILPTE